MKTTTKNILLVLPLLISITTLVLIFGFSSYSVHDRTIIALKRGNCELEILKEYLETNPNATVLDYANRIQKDCWMKGGDKT